MANWCYNTVSFDGIPEIIDQIQNVFKTMLEKQKQDDMGHLPDFVDEDKEGYFYDIWLSDTKGTFDYSTKWNPNFDVLIEIADYYKVGFTLNYDESGNSIYGKAIYKDGELEDIFLDEEDFEQYEYDEDEDCYHFEGQEYEGDSEILEILLQRKIDA